MQFPYQGQMPYVAPQFNQNYTTPYPIAYPGTYPGAFNPSSGKFIFFTEWLISHSEEGDGAFAVCAGRKPYSNLYVLAHANLSI